MREDAETRARKAREPRPVSEFLFAVASGKRAQQDPKNYWASVCKTAGVENLRIHDLRHSYASLLASGGASLPLIGALLGHTQPQTTQRYAHLFDEPQRAAADRVVTILTAAETGKTAEVMPLPKRGGRNHGRTA